MNLLGGVCKEILEVKMDDYLRYKCKIVASSWGSYGAKKRYCLPQFAIERD